MPAIRMVTPVPGPKSQAFINRRQTLVPKAVSMLHPLCIREAKGALITDVDGNTFIDFTSGIGVLNVGHTHDKVVEAIGKQAKRLLHSCFQVAGYDDYLNVAERLVKLTPGDFEKRVFLVSSGAEAVENAVKIARGATKRGAVLVFDHAFHGRTFMALTMTSKTVPYKVGLGPYAPEIYRLPFPYAYRGQGQELLPKPGEVADGKHLAKALKTVVRPEDLAAVVFEPVLGEGGFIPASPEFMAEVRAFCNTYGIVMIADEIQSGFCRTGKMFACEALGAVPDVVTVAKSLAGGMPLAGVVAKASLIDVLPPGALGGTYAGNPLACAAAMASLDVMQEEKLADKAVRVGQVIRERMQTLAKECSGIGDIRGLGAMMAIELVRDRATKEAADTETQAVIAAARQKGLLLLSAGTYGNVLRFLAPLTIEEAVLNEGLDVLSAALKEVFPRAA